ncbi:hypothetical protein B4U84_28150 [Westiellopsis prolifica IICB1]|nr:hypothetical protein B4U84_28150 [Westiellopsis prolifica IICB1]
MQARWTLLTTDQHRSIWDLPIPSMQELAAQGKSFHYIFSLNLNKTVAPACIEVGAIIIFIYKKLGAFA